MRQEAIWDYFQNEGVHGFDQTLPRMQFIAGYLRTGERVLNIGIGGAVLERLAIQKGVEIWSLDPGDRAVEKIRVNLDMKDRAVVGYSQSMPFPDGFFDKVVMTEVIEHLDRDVNRLSMDEVARVLKEGGKLVGTVPAREDLDNQTVICPHCEKKFHRWGHERSFSVSSIAESIGPKYKTIAQEEFFTPWQGVGFKTKIASIIKKTLSNRGVGSYGTSRNIFFVAEKL